MNNKVLYIFIVIVLLSFWQYFGSTNNTVRLLLSSPSLVLDYFTDNFSELTQATLITFIEAFVGLLIATFFSFSVMFLCFYFPKLMDFVLPIMVASQVIPLIVLAPFFIILLGIGLESKIAMAALMCFFPIFLNFVQGYKSISQDVHDLLHIYNANIFSRIKNVYFPLAMPNIMTGLKISSTLAVIGAIVAEFTGSTQGLGKNLFLSAIRLEPDLMMSSLVLSTLLGAVIFGSIYFIEKRLARWNEK